MIVRVTLVLALADFTCNCLHVDAAQLYGTITNSVSAKLKRSADGTGCELPSPLKNGRYTPSERRCFPPHNSSAYCQMTPGTQVEAKTPIYFQCNPGYTLNDASGQIERKFSVCNHGQWTPSLPPVCLESHYDAENLPEFQSPSSYCGKTLQRQFTTSKDDSIQSRKGAWPWLAALGMRKDNTTNGIHWFCAGTLITTRHIITAAHCVFDNQNVFFVRFNDINLSDGSDDEDILDIEIQMNNVLIHPGFKKDQEFAHNLAIIKLNSNLPITDFLRPICLPSSDFKGKTFDNETVHLITWGQTEDVREWNRNQKRGRLPILKHRLGSVVNHYVCNRNYRNYQSYAYIIINWDILCASIPSEHSCQGDAGSPLMLRVKNKYVLLGVVATPHACYDDQYPRLFTKLSQYMHWIIGDAGSPVMLKVKDKYVLLGVLATTFTCYDDQVPQIFTKLSQYIDWIIVNTKF